MTPLARTSSRTLALGTTGALVAGLIAAAAPAHAAVNVDVPPTKTISGELSGPIGIEDDAAGNIYLASQLNNAIVVHRKNASGASAPLRRISGPATQLSFPRDVAFDTNRFLYVANGNGLVLVFPPNANGNVAPIRTFGTGAGTSYAIDIAGGEIYVRKATSYHVYSPAAAGSPAPTERTVSGLGFGQALKVFGTKVWVPSGTQLRAYSRSADGAATPIQAVNNALPAAEINGVDADPSGRVFVSAFNGTVRVFSPSADGNDGPLKVLGGPASGLNSSTGIEVLSGGAIAVANYFDSRYSVFPDLFKKPATKPGKVRALKVGGKQKSKVRKVSWKAPASNGGAKITSYRIVVKKGSKVLVKRTVSGSKRALVVKRSKLRNGVNTVYVHAKNSKGYGKVAKKSFRVRK
ncbi:hypothetical protein AFL01nite_07510 [Aeromicrobium flavum]|uniref:Fibronectin type-III domain-containing protein n=1 Tax=Aeromicrobium flavum TaxID=416568 RepID=A0A512HSI9_9ACTN|nr:hypothetical protein [Aeromicrobium flavum]GEO88424.1 hypothetical protein AFL01nite_07510 [Aeromicrobium flavum]